MNDEEYDRGEYNYKDEDPDLNYEEYNIMKIKGVAMKQDDMGGGGGDDVLEM